MRPIVERISFWEQFLSFRALMLILAITKILISFLDIYLKFIKVLQHKNVNK